MRIGLIRHFPVKKEFLKGRVKQSEVLQWFHEYNEAPVEQMEAATLGQWKKCYSSQLSRAVATAETIFEGKVEAIEWLNEPFPSPIFKRDIKLPFLLWALLFRLAIISNHSSQVDNKRAIQSQIERVLNQLLREEDDILIVGHAFTMEILSALLLQKGFRGKRLSRPKHGILYVFEK